MGAEIKLDDGYMYASATQGLHGAEIVFRMVTVTGTENILMAATGQGETTIINAAREPEVGDLAECLVAMGAEIKGIGTDKLHVVGKDRLHAATHSVIADRIGGTFAMAAAITHGDMESLGVRMDTLVSRFKTLAARRLWPKRRRMACACMAMASA